MLVAESLCSHITAISVSNKSSVLFRHKADDIMPLTFQENILRGVAINTNISKVTMDLHICIFIYDSSIT